MTADDRKKRPIFSGLLKYFPDALEEIAFVSFIGNEQHNPGTPLHWDRKKSMDQMDAGLRHDKDYASGIEFDTDGVRHLAKSCWRHLAQLQLDIENARKTTK